MENIQKIYDEVCTNTKNRAKVNNFKQYKCAYISKIYDILINRKYVPAPLNTFVIYKPKQRLIASQNMIDKVINHLVSRYVLYPALLPCLLDVNVASRKNLGTKAGLDNANKFHNICKRKYGTYYILKCDISKFFASIDHNILKKKLIRRIKDKEALKIVFDIIDSEEKGLSIGLMTSQILAIFYLNDMDYYIKKDLKIKYYVRYQDDFLLFHESKDYLKFCLKEIEIFLQKEKLTLNNKTRIYKSTNNFVFLGKNRKNRYARYRNVKRKLKKKRYLYYSNKISLDSITSSIINYEHLCKKNNLLK